MKTLHNQFLADGSQAIVHPDFRWDLTLPGGIHVRGEAKSLDGAQQALKSAYHRSIIERWERGSNAPDKREPMWLCPLK